MKPYLTDEEIAEITDPLTQGAARCRYFREVLKCPVEPKPNGQPHVKRVDYDGRPAQAPRAANDAPPTRDWTPLREKVQHARRGPQAQER